MKGAQIRHQKVSLSDRPEDNCHSRSRHRYDGGKSTARCSYWLARIERKGTKVTFSVSFILNQGERWKSFVGSHGSWFVPTDHGLISHGRIPWALGWSCKVRFKQQLHEGEIKTLQNQNRGNGQIWTDFDYFFVVIVGARLDVVVSKLIAGLPFVPLWFGSSLHGSA